ncbi:MAG: HEAT repeat domain-containing protein, partial [Planctomycetota bacterium]
MRATGGGAGGTYTWEIVQGGDKIALVSPSFAGGGAPTPPGTDDDSVRILGLAPSAALNDVQIKATWRSADGSQECSDMLELTVIAATLTLRADGVWSNANDAVRDQTRGDPALGDIRPDIPLGAKGFFQNVEIASTVTPCVDAFLSDLEFVQQKQGWAIRRSSAGFNQVDWFESCDPTAGGDSWCDDSPSADSQDTAATVTEGCAVFMVDSPGIVVAGGACGGADTDMTNLLCMRFRSRLCADGYRVSSNSIRWWVKREVRCDLGAWLRQDNFYGNSFGAGEGAVCPLPGATSPIAAPQEDGRSALRQWDLKSLVRELDDADPVVRGRAGMALLTRLSPGTLSPAQRASIVEDLVRVAGRTRERYEFDSAELWAIRALGRAGATEAVEVLLDRVGDEFPRFVTASSRRTPAAGALARIGVPAVAPILERCGTADAEKWRLMAGVLRRIDKDSALVREAMRTMLEAQAWFESVEAAGGVPQPDEAERARRARVKQ